MGLVDVRGSEWSDGDPTEVTRLDIDARTMSPRFLYREKSGAHAPNVRLIEDIARSWVNLITELPDTYNPQCSDYFLALSGLNSIQGANDLLMRIGDFANAYNTNRFVRIPLMLHTF